MVEIKKYGISEKIAVLSIAVLLYTVSLVNPALGEISKAFPNVSSEIIKTISVIPSLVMVVTSLLAGQIARFMSSKKILYIGIAFQLVGGVLPAFFGGISFILFTRVIFGAGYGLVFPLASSVISELFEGGERASLMGIKSSVGAVAGIIFTMLGGILAATNWRYCFLGILLVIPIGLVIFFKLPEVVVKKGMDSEEVKGDKLTAKTYAICVFNIIFNILMVSFMTNVAIVITAADIGNATQAGVVLMMFTVGAAIAGVIYGKIAYVFKNYTLSLAIGLLACAFFVLLNAATTNAFIVGAVIFGLGFGIYNPNMILAVINSAHKTAQTLAVSIYVAVQGVGQFSSPYVLRFLTNAIGLTGERAAWTVVAYTFTVICVLSVVLFTLMKALKVKIA